MENPEIAAGVVHDVPDDLKSLRGKSDPAAGPAALTETKVRKICHIQQITCNYHK